MDSNKYSYVPIDEEAGITRGRRKKNFSAFDPNTSRPTFCVGMTFESACQFKEALAKYVIM